MVDPDGRPNPHDATTVAEYVDSLRRLKDWTGLSYRQLERRAADAGDVLPRATLTAALSRGSLPREDLVTALLRACGQDAPAVAEWATARRRLAAGAAVPVTTPVVPPIGAPHTAADSADIEPPAPPSRRIGRRTGGALTFLLPASLRRAGWPVRFVAVVLVSVATTVVTIGLRAGSTSPGAGNPRADAATPAVDSAPSAVPSTRSVKSSSIASPAPRTPSRQLTSGAVDRTTTVTTAALADTTLVKGVPDAANGHDPILSTCGRACADSSTAGFERRVLLKFDLIRVPAGGCPTAVTLRLWAENAPGTFNLYPVGDNWSETTASWNDRPERGAALAQAYTSTAAGWLSFRLPAGTGRGRIHSFEVDGTDRNTGEFAAREETTIARPPELVVTHAACT